MGLLKTEEWAENQSRELKVIKTIKSWPFERTNTNVVQTLNGGRVHCKAAKRGKENRTPTAGYGKITPSKHTGDEKKVGESAHSIFERSSGLLSFVCGIKLVYESALQKRYRTN